ncbi:hypothetical protein [Agrococcus citreus]|uniref:Uncharacterized protein n=1 Tax=Agrococcus citreus TaxID=84643 RepID=A0ABP4JI37_9MICO
MAAEDQIAAVAGELLVHSPGAALSVATAYAYSQLVHPTVKVTGQTMATAWETRLSRWLKITKDAGEMTPEGMIDKPVSERVLARSTGESTLFDDSVQQRYASGIIASSRTGESGDDRGVAFLAILEAMPASHVRLHYAFYTSMRDAILVDKIDTASTALQQSAWSLPFDAIKNLFDDANHPAWAATEAIEVLKAQGLISHWPNDEDMLRFGYTNLGLSLYGWAHGAAQIGLDLSDAEFPAHTVEGPRFESSASLFRPAQYFPDLDFTLGGATSAEKD